MTNTPDWPVDRPIVVGPGPISDAEADAIEEHVTAGGTACFPGPAPSGPAPEPADALGSGWTSVGYITDETTPFHRQGATCAPVALEGRLTVDGPHERGPVTVWVPRG